MPGFWKTGRQRRPHAPGGQPGHFLILSRRSREILSRLWFPPITCGSLSPDQEAALRQRLGLDGPWLCRFVSWTGKAMTGDFGLSLRTNAPVAQEINARLIATLELNALALPV